MPHFSSYLNHMFGDVDDIMYAEHCTSVSTYPIGKNPIKQGLPTQYPGSLHTENAAINDCHMVHMSHHVSKNTWTQAVWRTDSLENRQPLSAHPEVSRVSRLACLPNSLLVCLDLSLNHFPQTWVDLKLRLWQLCHFVGLDKLCKLPVTGITTLSAKPLQLVCCVTVMMTALSVHTAIEPRPHRNRYAFASQYIYCVHKNRCSV